jgi:hypothetical protein
MLEMLIVIAVLAVAGWLYRWGKRVGSRLGYGAGRFRRRRR